MSAYVLTWSGLIYGALNFKVCRNDFTADLYSDAGQAWMQDYVEWAVPTRTYGNTVPLSCCGNTGARSIWSQLNVYCTIAVPIKS